MYNKGEISADLVLTIKTFAELKQDDSACKFWT